VHRPTAVVVPAAAASRYNVPRAGKCVMEYLSAPPAAAVSPDGCVADRVMRAAAARVALTATAAATGASSTARTLRTTPVLYESAPVPASSV
jgi:hypothetical protein